MMEAERITGTDVQRGLPDSRCQGQRACVLRPVPSLEVMGALNMDGGLQCRALPDVALIVRL